MSIITNMNQLLSSMRPAYYSLGAVILLSSCEKETREGLLRHTGDYISDVLHEILPEDPDRVLPPTHSGNGQLGNGEKYDPLRPSYEDDQYDDEPTSTRPYPHPYPDEHHSTKPRPDGRPSPSLSWGERLYNRAQALLKPSVSGEASYDHEIIRLIKQSAHAGYVKAQRDLAGLYLEGGKGIEENKQLAYNWFQKAAAQGDQAARYYAAHLLYYGDGIIQDKAKALDEWREAADAGLGEAQYQLAKILIRSKKTRDEGLQYLNRAAQSGIMGAARDLGYMHAKGKWGFSPNMRHALYWYNIAAEAGDPESLYISALFLLEGKYIQPNRAKAIHYLKMAAGQDHADAMEQLITTLKERNRPADRTEIHQWQRRLLELRDKQNS